MLTLFIQLSLHIDLISSCLLWSNCILAIIAKIFIKPSLISKKLIAEADTTRVPTFVVDTTEEAYEI